MIDDVARAAIYKLSHMLEQVIQLSGNHLHLAGMHPELERLRASLYPNAQAPNLAPDAPQTPVQALASAYGVPSGPGCAACKRSPEQLMASGHDPECDAIRNPLRSETRQLG